MPVVGSSAYNTAGQITSLVRSLLNDAQGNLFTDAVLLPYTNSAYRKLQRALGNAGGGGFIQDDALLVVTAVTQPDTSLQVSITDATAPPNQLPTDLLVPVKIWERRNGSTDDFLEMVDLTQHGGLPSRVQDVTLSVWEWRADGLYFLGATQDTQIRLRYLKAYPDFTDATSPVLVRNAQEALAYATAALAGWARGSLPAAAGPFPPAAATPRSRPCLLHTGEFRALSGQRFDPNRIAAAMTAEKVKLGQTVKVTYAYEDERGKTVTRTVSVIVNDRGPFARNADGKPLHPLRPDPRGVIDLTPAAFRQLVGTLRVGRVHVTVTVPNE